MSPVLPPRARSEPARALVAALAVASAAGASEPRTATEPRVLEQPAHITNVLDAFDESGGVDFHFTLGYEQSFKRALILRETHDAELASGGYDSAPLGVGRFTENTSRLHARAAVGLYRDVQLVIRAPVVLSNRRELE